MSSEPPSKDIALFRDPLDSETSIKASLSASGIDVAAQSRIIAAIDNLGGGLIDSLGGAWLDGFRRRQRTRDAVKEALIYEAGQAELEDFRAERAALRFQRELLRKQEAREAIAQIAFEEVKRLPPPSHDESEEGLQAELNEDWMNAFSAFAENATEDKLRVLWAKILAKEMLSPGRFSRSTLRVISELEAQAALAFGRAMSFRLPEGYFFMDKSIKSNDVTLLIDAGLVQAQEVGIIAQKSNGWNYWRSGDWILRINSHLVEGRGISPIVSMPLIHLTGAGRELSRIFDLPNTRDIMMEIGKNLDK